MEGRLGVVNRGFPGTSLLVQWLKICLAVHWMQIWSLVKEVRSHEQLSPRATTRGSTCCNRKIPCATTKTPAEPKKYIFFKKNATWRKHRIRKREREREASWIKVASNVRTPSTEELASRSIQTEGRDLWRQQKLWFVQQVFTREAGTQRWRWEARRRGLWPLWPSQSTGPVRT